MTKGYIYIADFDKKKSIILTLNTIYNDLYNILLGKTLRLRPFAV